MFRFCNKHIFNEASYSKRSVKDKTVHIYALNYTHLLILPNNCLYITSFYGELIPEVKQIALI